MFARADADGALRAERGRVEIRYKPNDGKRYDASVGNLSVVDGAVLPDETCGPAESVAKAAASGAGSGAASSKAAAKAAVKGAPKGSSKARAVAGYSASSVPEGAVVAYADGACSGNPGPAGLGVVLIDGPRRVEISKYLGEGTNNIAELTAVLCALEEVADEARPLIIRTDSQYTIGVLQKGWKAKANKELIEDLREALRGRSGVKLEYVPGHSGFALNERADELAREAVSSRRSRRSELPKPAEAVKEAAKEAAKSRAES